MLTKFLRASTSKVTIGNLTATYIGTTQTNSNNTTHALTNVSIGAADNYRRIVVTVGTVGTGSGDTVNTVTVGGVSLTKHVEVSGAIGVAVFSEVITTGTTATIVVTTSGNSDIAVRVFNITGATSSYSSSSSASGTTTSITSSPNLTVGANDVGVFAASQQSGNAVSESVSTGTRTESSDVTFTANSSRRTAAGYVTYDSSSSSATITLTGDSGITKKIALATFTSP